MKRAMVLMSGLAMTAAASPAFGSERVVVVAPEGLAGAEGVVHQVTGELRSAGFSVVVRARASEPDSRELEALARETDSFAALALWIPAETIEAEVWVVDLVTGKTVLRRLKVRSMEERPSIFALRAVELLQASLLELETGRPPGGEIPPSPPVRRFAHAARPRAVEPLGLPDRPKISWSLLAGVAVVGGPGGLPPALAPSTGLAWRPSPAWSGQLWASGPALATLEDDEGSATLDQELLALRFAYTWTDENTPVSGYVVAGAGAYRLGARGAAEPPYESASVAVWSASLLAGPGLSLRMSDRFRLFAETDAVWLLSRPEVRFAGRPVAFGGRPWFIGSLGADVRW